jgi:APA family basic amino acid/polyamine antiporter
VNATGESKNVLPRRLGLLLTSLTGIGVILGSGIYVIVGIAVGMAGNAVWISFVISAAAAGLTGLSYARLAKIQAKDAPEFHYVNRAFGRLPAFLAGWLVLFSGIISAATVALGFASYFSHLFPIAAVPSAIGLVLICTLIVFLGIGESTIIASVLTVVEVGGLIFIIIVGIPFWGSINYLETPSGLVGILQASSLIFLAYLGFETMANLAEEMKRPERDLPLAIFIALGVSTLLYVLVAISTISILDWRNLSQSSAPLAAVAGRVLGEKADLVLTVIALGSTANTVLVILIAMSRAMWAMSGDGVLPMFLSTLGEKRHTPWLTILIVGVFASLFTLVGNIEQIAEFTNFSILIVFAGVNASGIKIFNAAKNKNRAGQFILNRLFPLLGAVVSLLLAVLTGWYAALLGGVIVLAGTAFYFIWKVISRKKKGQSTSP